MQEGSEEDQIEDKFTSELPNYYPQKTYADQIKKLLRQRRVGTNFALNFLLLLAFFSVFNLSNGIEIKKFFFSLPMP